MNPVLATMPREDHEPGTWPWFKSEGAKLIYRALDDDVTP